MIFTFLEPEVILLLVFLRKIVLSAGQVTGRTLIRVRAIGTPWCIIIFDMNKWS